MSGSDRVGRDPQRAARRIPTCAQRRFTHKGILTLGRLEKLKELEAKLHDSLDYADSKSLAGIAKQYRETIKEIEEIEGATDDDDDIEKILAERDSAGKAGAVR